MAKLPLAAMDRIMREVSAERVSDRAKEVLRTCLEEEAEKIIKKAHQLSKHAGRTTILKEDILLAKKNH